MKKLIWKPSSVSWQIHMVIAISAIIGIIIIEVFKVNIRQPYYKHKIRAARIMKKQMDIIREYREKNIGRINKKFDPIKSGFIGVLSTPITSAQVDIDAKQTTINPNWAAVLIQMLRKAGVREGGTIAASFTGSFPAINIAVLSAARAMNLKVIYISSVASSTWGANLPNFTWLDMEAMLSQKGFFPYRSIAASLGGVKDNALGLTEEGRRLLRQAVQRNRIPLLEYEDVKENINARMELYQEKAGDTPIAAYINVGGGTVSIGSYLGKARFKPGLNLRPSRKALMVESVISRFAREETPVINMNYMRPIARKYGLPIAPNKMPAIGEGEIYNRLEYNSFLVAGILAALLLLLYLFLKQGVGYRIFTTVKKESRARLPEKMV